MKNDDVDQAAANKNLPPLTLPPRQRGWFRRNWKWVIPFGLLITVVIGAGVLYWAFYTRVYNLEACQSAMSAIASDAAVLEALGKPIQAVKWPSQKVMPSARVDESEVDVLWTVEGPKGQAKAHVLSKKRQGKWETVILEVTPPDGKTKISIRAPGDSDNVAKPWTPDANPPAKTPETKQPETKGSDLNIDLPIPPADGPPETK